MKPQVLVAYALPVLVTQFVYTSFTTVLPGVYAKYFGLSAASIAFTLLVTRLFDAVSDPLIGYLSDASQSRLGRRKPWIAAGTVITAIAIWQISQPDQTVDVARHFTVWALVFYLGWTMMEIPHTAWGSELDSSYDGRNKTFFTRSLIGVVGPLGFAAIPVLINAPTTEITPQVMSAAALVFILVAPVCVGISLLYAPIGTQVVTASRQNLSDSFRAIATNQLFWRLFAVFVTGGLAAGINGTLMFVYFDTFLGLGDKLAYAMGAMLLSALIGLPLWLFVLRYLDKSRAWSVSLLLASLWVAAPAILSPGEGAFIPVVVMVVGLALSSGAGVIVPFSLLGDVVDYDHWKSGQNRAGAYYAVFMFGVKLNAAIGGSLAFGLLALFGYDAAATVHTDFAVMGLKLTYAIVPAGLFAMAAVFVFYFPLTKSKHDIIRRALARRVDRVPGQ
ncbi:MAG: MFS transporter [Pseudomonadales bacterium]